MDCQSEASDVGRRFRSGSARGVSANDIQLCHARDRGRQRGVGATAGLERGCDEASAERLGEN